MGTQVDLTTAEAETYMRLSRVDGAIVRLVDPVEQQVVNLSGEVLESAACHSVWGKCERCENCTSLRALQTKGVAYKLELIDDRTYLVTSRYLLLEGKGRILEIVTDITDSFIMDSGNLDEIGTIINTYNHQLVTDPLTDIYNRRFLDESFVPSLDCCHEKGITVNVAILDLDGFKKVNDTYGHQAGDALLRDVAGFWHRRFDSRSKNKERIVVRYGGDEMLVIVCGMSSKKFKADVAQSYREMRKVCYWENDTAIAFSISFGMASSAELDKDWTWEDLLAVADRRLYADKQKR